MKILLVKLEDAVNYNKIKTTGALFNIKRITLD